MTATVSQPAETLATTTDKKKTDILMNEFPNHNKLVMSKSTKRPLKLAYLHK